MSWAHESSGIFARSGLRMVTSELYSSTSVLVPVGWDVAHIGQLFDFRNGLNKAKRFFGTGTPIVNYMDVFERPGLKAADISGRVTLSSQEIESFNVRRGDVFFTRTSETVEDIGAAAVMLDDPCDTVFSGFILRARPLNDRLDDHYKRYCFASKSVRSQIVSNATYTTRALTNGKVLSSVKILIPPLAEQRAIATALSDMDSLLDSLDALIAKKRTVKQATMQQLLTGRTRMAGFTDEWAATDIHDLLTYERPDKHLVQDTGYSEYGLVPVLTANKSFILGYTDENFGVCNNLPVIVFDDFTTDSKFMEVPFKVKSSAIKLLRSKHACVNLRFVYERMKLIRFPIGEHKRYYISEYQNLTLMMPGYDEQNVIAAILTDMDAEIAALERRREKTQAIKQGMMQELLTGRVRLVEAR